MYPASKGLFEKVEMEKQKKLLASSLTFIVDHLHETDKVVNYLQKLGSRHHQYGAKAEHLQWVGEALLGTFAHFLGAKWTEGLKDEWTVAYGIVAEQMTIGLKKETQDI